MLSLFGSYQPSSKRSCAAAVYSLRSVEVIPYCIWSRTSCSKDYVEERKGGPVPFPASSIAFGAIGEVPTYITIFVC